MYTLTLSAADMEAIYTHTVAFVDKERENSRRYNDADPAGLVERTVIGKMGEFGVYRALGTTPPDMEVWSRGIARNAQTDAPDLFLTDLGVNIHVKTTDARKSFEPSWVASTRTDRIATEPEENDWVAFVSANMDTREVSIMAVSRASDLTGSWAPCRSNKLAAKGKVAVYWNSLKVLDGVGFP